MRLVILAAGMGSRMESSIQKSMFLVGRETIAERIIRQSGLKDVIMVVGYNAEAVMDYFHPFATFAYNPYWSTTGPVCSLRIAGAVYDGPAVIVYGDTVFKDNDVQNVVQGRNTVGLKSQRDEGSAFIHKDGPIARVRKYGEYSFSGIVKVSNIMDFVGGVADTKPVGSCIGGTNWADVDSVNINTRLDLERARLWIR